VTDRVLAQIAALAKASLPDLKAHYRDLFGVEAAVTNRGYLERRIAYRLQELAYGALSQATKGRLEALARTADKGCSPRSRIKDRPLAGTRLIRVCRPASSTEAGRSPACPRSPGISRKPLGTAPPSSA